MGVCPDYTLQMMTRYSGWQTEEGGPAYVISRITKLTYVQPGDDWWRMYCDYSIASGKKN